MYLLLSPHFDDVAFCMGGLLSECPPLGRNGLLVTFFTKSKHAPYHLWHGDVQRVSALRLLENNQFSQMSGLKSRNLNFSEGTLDGYSSIDELFDGRDVFTDRRAKLLYVRVTELAKKYIPKLVFVPLSIGSHIEHRMLRRVAEDVFPAELLAYYEDLPYAGKLDNVDCLPEVSSHQLTLVPIVVPIRDWNAKLEMIGCYASQIVDDERRAITAHALRIGGGAHAERFWLHHAALSRFPLDIR